MASRKPSTPPGQNDPEQDDGLAVAERPRTKKPRRYHVVLHNDDYTTMEFVVHVLMKFFHMSETDATQVMLHVHHKGYGIVGDFTRDVAETKATRATEAGRAKGYPLTFTTEPEE